MGQQKRTTLKDVANLANVSVATVSVVLNGKSNVRISEETKKRVIKASKELRYQPDISAQILKGKTSSIVGLMVPDITNPYYPELVRGIMDKANQLGYNVILLNSDDSVKQEQFFIETLRAINVAGMIVSGVSSQIETEQELFTCLNATGMPLVVVDRGQYDSRFNSILVENRTSGEKATQYLIDMGHRKIAILANNLQMESIHNRYRGYLDALSANHIAPDKNLLFEVNSTEYDELAKVVKKLLRTKPKSTALFVISGDLTAIRVIKILKEMGLRVPNDLSVVGYDDIPMADLISPALTTVWQPKYAMGSSAMETLHAIIQEKKTVRKTTVFETELVLRDSVKALNK